jgi:hypothetical protein
MRRPRSSIRAQKEEPIESVLGMTRSYLVFGDIEGKLDVLRVECTKCDRKGRYYVHKLIEKYGRVDVLICSVGKRTVFCVAHRD